MKLYEIPSGSIFRVNDDQDKTKLKFDHIDGMYSVCYTVDTNELVHIAAFASVTVLRRK